MGLYFVCVCDIMVLRVAASTNCVYCGLNAALHGHAHLAPLPPNGHDFLGRRVVQVCSVCKKELEDSFFYKDARRKNGLQTKCKECAKALKREWRAKNADRVRDYQKDWFDSHPEYQKERRLSMPEKMRDYQKHYRELHQDAMRDRWKSYYYNNKDKVRESRAAYYSNNKEKFAEYQRSRRLGDEMYRFKSHMRQFIWAAFRRKSWAKGKKTESVIGCSFDEAKAHLEQTWLDNYGTKYNGEPVHIDHIIPLASAQTEDDVVRLCHISNLQYLTPEDNKSKSDKII